MRRIKSLSLVKKYSLLACYEATLDNQANMKQVKEDPLMDPFRLKMAALWIRAANHAVRQQLLRLLHTHRRMTVTELYRKIGLKQAETSLHLGILRRAGLVRTQREGKQIFYAVDYEQLDAKQRFVTELLKDG
jgi:DNA-binding transcriptional ArsR family regulator